MLAFRYGNLNDRDKNLITAIQGADLNILRWFKAYFPLDMAVIWLFFIDYFVFPLNSSE